MASHWDITDNELKWQLERIRAAVIAGGPWVMHLYQNDYVPAPGSSEGDYVESTFPGYVPSPIDVSTFGVVTVLNHIAKTQNTVQCVFTADPTGFVEQSVTGYFVTDDSDTYIYGEAFASAVTIHPDETLKVTPILRLGTYPNP